MNNTVSRQPLYLVWSGFVVSAFFFLCALFFGVYSGSAMFAGPALLSALGMVYALLAVGRVHFLRRESLEEENLREQHEGFTHRELFEDSSDDALRFARRLSRNYTLYAVPLLALLSALAAVFVSWYYWRSFGYRLDQPTLRDPFRYAVMSLGLFVVALLAGSYYIGKSREHMFRWLRPVGAVLAMTGFFLLLSGLGLVFIQWRPDYLVWDIYLGRALLAGVMILAAEAVITIVVDYYRPRIPGEEPKPVYESRVLAVFSEPGGIARNIALTLDYQFGFEVSEAKFYRFLERTMIPLSVFMVFGLWLMTCFVVIDADETGIRERFGRVVAGRDQPLSSGLYLKLPLPFERIRTYPTGKVQTLSIGYVPAADGEELYMEGVEPGDPSGRVIVWSRAHNIEETNFVVAVRDLEVPETMPSETEPRPVPVSFIAASIPVHYRVDNLYAYLYENSDSRRKLENLATREVVAYLATVDFFEFLIEKRGESGRILQANIQRAAERHNLGVEVVFVGLEGLHPPVRVGSSFDQVVSASEEMLTEILRSEQYSIRRRPEARAESFRMRAEAEMYELGRVSMAKAEGERFLSQLTAYRAAPELYPLRAFLDLMESEGNEVRKYIIGMPQAAQVLILNLEEKLRPDLLDLDFDAVMD